MSNMLVSGSGLYLISKSKSKSECVYLNIDRFAKGVLSERRGCYVKEYLFVHSEFDVGRKVETSRFAHTVLLSNEASDAASGSVKAIAHCTGQSAAENVRPMIFVQLLVVVVGRPSVLRGRICEPCACFEGRTCCSGPPRCSSRSEWSPTIPIAW